MNKYSATPIQILLGFVLRHNDMAAIPKAVKKEHIEQNAAAGNIRLDGEDSENLSRSFPATIRKMEMEKI